MHQALTSSDHLSVGAHAVAEAGVRAQEEGRRGQRFISFDFGGSGPSSAPGRESPAARCGLIAVADIICEDLRTVVWYGSALTLLYLLVGGGWFMISDCWTFSETFYFMATSLMTIGYGDVVVSSKGADHFLDSLLILVGLLIVTIWATCASRAAQIIGARPAGGLGFPAPESDAEAAIHRYRWMLARRVAFLSVAVAIGVIVFMMGEGTGFVTSFYWAIVTASSIGYGDIVPTTTPMRWFTVLYSFVATGTMLETLRFVGAYPFKVSMFRAQGKVYEQFKEARSASERAAAVAVVDNAVTELLGIPAEARPGGTISRTDVALSVLLLLNRVSSDEVQQAIRVFDKLGLGRDGPPLPVQTGVEPERP
eukprot:g20477.t1